MLGAAAAAEIGRTAGTFTHALAVTRRGGPGGLRSPSPAIVGRTARRFTDGGRMRSCGRCGRDRTGPRSTEIGEAPRTFADARLLPRPSHPHNRRPRPGDLRRPSPTKIGRAARALANWRWLRSERRRGRLRGTIA